MTNVVIMKKTETQKKSVLYKQKNNTSKVQEPMPLYKPIKAMPLLKEFTYTEFKKIADKTPFTQGEWAAMLHVSERTLQRYAKSNGSFAYINAERAMQIANVAAEGKKTFGKVEMFYNWLKRKPVMLEGEISLTSLTTSYGIQLVLTELGRIQHGILA
jgi:putative toxin-antitoxin system antitoxin component (TIGR02293 family)